MKLNLKYQGLDFIPNTTSQSWRWGAKKKLDETGTKWVGHQFSHKSEFLL